jgi:TetR/AcrR family transcriptional repressor of nem operon
MKQNTKQKIIETGAEIIHLKGFHHTGIQEILDATGVPKGSFYNYFKSKDDFGLQVIDYYVGQFFLLSESLLQDPSLSPIDKLKKIFVTFMDIFKARDYAYGCPIGNLSQEMGDLSPAFRERLKNAVDTLAESCRGLLEEAQGGGEISAKLDLKEAAYFIISSWHGALMRMKVEKSLAPLRNHYHFIFDHILGHEHDKSFYTD